MRQAIKCNLCDFTGILKFDATNFSHADICYCPACGGDIYQPNSDDEIIDGDNDIQDSYEY